MNFFILQATIGCTVLYGETDYAKWLALKSNHNLQPTLNKVNHQWSQYVKVSLATQRFKKFHDRVPLAKEESNMSFMENTISKCISTNWSWWKYLQNDMFLNTILLYIYVCCVFLCMSCKLSNILKTNCQAQHWVDLETNQGHGSRMEVSITRTICLLIEMYTYTLYTLTEPVKKGLKAKFTVTLLSYFVDLKCYWNHITYSCCCAHLKP